LVEVLAEEKQVAVKRLLSMDEVIAKFRELTNEPLSKNWGLKLGIFLVVLLILQGAGYATYVVVKPIVFPAAVQLAAVENEDPALTKLFAEAEKQQNVGKFAESEAILTRIVTEHPESVKALDALGFSAMLQQDRVKAATYYEKAILLAPDDSLANQNLGVIAKEAGNFDDALTHFDDVLVTDPENTTVRFLAGEIYWQEKSDAAQAELLLRGVLQRLPTHKKSYLLLADIYRKNGETEKLQAIIAEAKKHLPKDEEIKAMAQ
jgi:tetratricopeptide (TPR) repeat protein